MRSVFRRAFTASLFLLVSIPLRAGFASDIVFLPAVGRVTGSGGAEFFTTVWATNLAGVSVEFTFEFLKQGQANTSPAFFTDSLAPGQTKVYENVIETKLGLTLAIGAAKITSTGDILVAERIFNQAPGADLGDTEGLFFAAVPKAFSINLGQSASIQGLNQGGSENFRYNFALVETKGAVAKVNVQVFDQNGLLLGQKAFALEPLEQLQLNVAEVVPGFSSINARITATVVDGGGAVLLAGAQLANISQDSSGFEMSFPDNLLGAAGVTSLNGLTGALTLLSGNGISITPSGSSISIAFTGGGSSGITSVTHDASLTGAGTGVSPLGIAVPLSITNSSLNEPLLFVQNTSTQGDAATFFSTNSVGVIANSDRAQAIVGVSTDSTAIFGRSLNGVFGVEGLVSSTANDAAGVHGRDGTITSDITGLPSAGVRGISGEHVGVLGISNSGIAVEGVTVRGSAVFGHNFSSENNASGVFGIDGTGAVGLTALSAGVRGESNRNVGVLGISGSLAVAGALKDGPQGELGSHRENKDWGVYTTGNIHGASETLTGTLTIAGSKSFVEPHPTDPTKEIRFVCLEGPESGTYFRGHGRVVNGFAKIAVPESFRMVTDSENITVQLTPVGGLAVLACVRKNLETIIVQGSGDVEFDYMINGVRKAYKDFEVIHANESFIPDGPDDRRFALYAPEIQKRLVATGIYNEDGTVNRETARRLGWDKEWKESIER